VQIDSSRLLSVAGQAAPGRAGPGRQGRGDDEEQAMAVVIACSYYTFAEVSGRLLLVMLLFTQLTSGRAAINFG